MRYLVLIAVLLSGCTAKPIFKTYHDWGKGEQETNEVIPASCVQRMREAMQWMAPMNRTYNENKRRDPYFDFEKQRREFEENSKKWEATMQDCVEGK